MNASNTSKGVVIYGGGMAGAVLAKALSAVTDVTLVDPLDYFEVPMAAPRNLVHPEFAEQSIVPFADALPGVRHVQGKLVELSPTAGVVEAVTGQRLQLQAQVTVLATGSRFASQLLRAVDGTSARRRDLYIRYSRCIEVAREIVIVGGGPIGVEVAGEITERHGSKQITIVEAGPRLLGGTTERAALHARRWLETRGVRVLTGERLVEGVADPKDVFGSPGVAITSGGRRVPYDLMIWCTGGRPNTDYLREHFASILNGQGRVKVTPELWVAGHPSICALGDITDLDENKMAWHVAGQVKTAAWNIRQALAGGTDGGSFRKYRPQTDNPSMVVTLGSRAGVAQLKGLGLVKAGWFVSMVKARHMLVPKYRRVLGLGS